MVTRLHEVAYGRSLVLACDQPQEVRSGFAKDFNIVHSNYAALQVNKNLLTVGLSFNTVQAYDQPERWDINRRDQLTIRRLSDVNFRDAPVV